MIKPPQTYVFGHRGASSDAPENTLTAFREAFRQSADGVEGDFRLTVDGHVVCIHDHCTQRTGLHSMLVRDSTLSQLRKIEYGAWKDVRFKGETLPTLRDILPVIPPDRWLVLEIKEGPEMVEPIARTFEEMKAVPDRILLISFDELVIAEAKCQLPNVLAHWLTDYQWDAVNDQWNPPLDTIIQTIHRCGADGLGSENRPQVLNLEFVRRLRNSGVDQFHVWTVDRMEEALYYRQLGAFAVTTNIPGRIRAAFQTEVHEPGHH